MGREGHVAFAKSKFPASATSGLLRSGKQTLVPAPQRSRFSLSRQYPNTLVPWHPGATHSNTVPQRVLKRDRRSGTHAQRHCNSTDLLMPGNQPRYFRCLSHTFRTLLEGRVRNCFVRPPRLIPSVLNSHSAGATAGSPLALHICNRYNDYRRGRA